MTTTFAFQDPGEGIAEAEVRSILVQVGDEIEEGQDVLVIETDKAAFDLASPHSGRVSDVAVSEGDIIHVGDPLLHFEQPDDGAKSEDQHDDGAKSEDQHEAAGGNDTPASARSERDASPASNTKPGATARSSTAATGNRRPGHGARTQGSNNGTVQARGRRGQPVVPAAPATRRIARELGVSLAEVKPSGEHGRVLPEDVRKAAEASEREGGPEQRRQPDQRTGPREAERPAPDDEADDVERVQLRSIRRTTARRMATAWREVARVTHHDEADITELEKLRQELTTSVTGEGGPPITLTALLAKALTRTLSAFPRFNASFDAEQETLVIKHGIHLGVAVDTDQGLLVPVLHDAPRMSIARLARVLKERSESARAGLLTREDLTGGTFTLTNVGPLGGTGMAPMVNHPEVAILGVARARLAQRVTGTLDDFSVGVGLILPLSVSFDHRVIDGAEAARFMTHLVDGLEDTRRFISGV